MKRVIRRVAFGVVVIVAEGEMPPWSDVAVDREATLSVEDRAAVSQWALGPVSQPTGSRP